MSFSIPIETLATMQVSFKVGLPDGTFAFDVTPVNPFDAGGPRWEDGLQLHLRTELDTTGVTLTLSASWKSSDSESSLALSPNIGMPSRPWTVGTEVCSPSSSTGTETQDVLFKLFDTPENLDYIDVVDPFNIGYLTPSAWSDSSLAIAQSLPPRSRLGAARSSLRCPEASCDRDFTSRYMLAKHIRAHEQAGKIFFPCTLGCSMHFSRKHDRLRHEVNQHGRICEWGCEACSGVFSSEMTLKKHKCKGAVGLRWVREQS